MKKFTKLTNQIRETRNGVLTLMLCLTSMLLATSGSAQTTATFNASGNFITPAGVTTATVEAWGAGGAGGGSTSSSDGGGGGGGGAFSKSTGVSVSGTVPVVIGTGGVGDTGAGNNGGDSTFNTTTVIAKGGVGGSITSGTGGPGGAGGLSTASTGTTKFSGGTGGRGRDNNTGQGGPGGASAGTAANGTSGAGSWSTVTAAAAPTGGGKGGDGGTSGANGANGTAPGGGGGGSGDGTTTGGNGADGRIVITYTCPTYALTSAASATGPFCTASASVMTLRSSSMANGTYTVTYNLSGGNTATGSTASMTFASGSGTFTTSTLNSSATATTITVTGISSGAVGQGACVSTISTNNTATVTVLTVVANAGTAFTKTCAANALGAAIGEATTAGYTYSWSPATGLSSSTVSNPTANPTTTTTYTVTKTHTATGCSATASVTVTVDNTPPTAVAGANFTKTCTLNPTGKVIGETAVAGNTYSWSPTTGLSSSTIANPTANPTSTTTYTVTKTTTATGCSATASITVTVDTVAPTVSAGSAFTKTCVANVTGATIGEANVAGFTYSWSPTTGLSSSTVSNPIANPTTTTTYTVTKTSSTNGCFAAANVTVTVNNTLSVGAGTDFTKTCVTNPTGLAIGEANVAGNTYSWSPSLGLSNPSISNPTANPTGTTTYTVTKTNTATGCVATDAIIVTVNLTTPTVGAGADFTKTCVTNTTGASIGEAAESGHTYSWSPATGLSSSTAANPTANPTTTTTYTVTKTNTASGCTSTDSVIATVDTTTPTVVALTGTQTVCAASTTVFSSTTLGGTWGTSNSGVATVTNGTVTGVASGTTNINYTVTGANGCTTTVSRSVTVNPLPTSVVASGATSICNGASTNLTGSATIPSVSTTTPINENFNGVPTFTAAGTGTIFAQKNSGDAVGLTTITNNVDASKYMMTSASSFGSATTTSTLTSPAINTNGMSTLSFTYNHSYTRGNSGTNTAVVQVSTDNTNWTTVKTYTTNQGASNNFVADNVNLNAYVNNAALRIRFNTTITVNFGTGWWAVENPKLTATAPIAAQYSWIADTAPGVNGLPSGSGTPATGNISISVNPSVTTNYTLVATDSATGCNASSSSAVTVIVNPLTTNGNVTTSICAGGSYTWPANGQSYTTAQTGTTFVSRCNTATLNLTVNPLTTNGNVTTSICAGDSYTWPANGQSYTTAQTGTTFVSGCNTATLNLTVNPLTTNGDVTTSICAGDSYTWPANGQSYTTAQTGTTFVSGCNTATLDLTIIPSTTVGSLTTTACDSYTWALNSQSYSSTGIYTHVVGCNTATLDLTIVPSTTAGSLSTSACDTYIWAENSQSYTTSGTYTHVVGCNTATLDLTIIPSTTNGNATVNACVSYTWAENGQTYTSSGVYTHVVGCNTATLNLTVNTTPLTFYADTDGDGFGSGAAILSCTGQPANTSVNNTDCAPADSSKWRTANFYIDVDGDSFNNGFPAVSVCYGATVPGGYVSANNGVDCDDNSATANPNASEVLGNGIDDNCDGVIDEVTQTSNLVANQCGITLTNLVNTLFAYDLATYVPQLGPIQGYRFRVTNGATVRTFNSPTVGFNLMNLPGGVTYGTAYTVEVSVKSGGFYRAYGAPCIVNTPAVPNATFVVNPISGSTLSDISTSIFCQQVPTASGYRFRVKDGNTIVGIYSSPINRFSLINLGIANIDFATTYTIDVLLKFGNDWRPDTEYGPTALITTPATPGTSRVIRPICGTTINALWTTIFAQQIVGAQGYKFVVTNGAQTREFTTANPRFQLPLLAGGAAANTAYTIRVDVLYNNSYVEGTVLCTLTTSPAATRQTNGLVNIYEVNANPNPFAETFKLNVNTSNEDLVKISVYDMLGREVESRQATVAAIMNVEIGSQYPSGVYNIIVTQGENVKTLRIIKR